MEYIKQQYKKSFVFFEEHLKKLTLITFVLFLIVIIVSAYYLKDHINLIQNIMQEFMNMANSNGIVSDTGNISSIGLMLNNLKACLMSIAVGVIPFLFLPLITLIINAGLIGAMFGLFAAMNAPMASLFAGLLPHGIFEIPALVISMTLGIYVCKEITMKILGKRKEIMLGTIAGSVINFYVCVIVPLLIVAGLIEAYITPYIMNLFM